MLKRLLIVLMFLSLASSASAQNMVKVKLTDSTASGPSCTAKAVPCQWYQMLPVTKKTTDKNFWLSSLVSVGATVLDVENTKLALSKTGAYEANPLFGSGHPSRGKLYGITMPLSALNIYMGYRYKREDDALKTAGIPGHKYMKWWVPNLLNTVTHIAAVGITVGETGK